MKNVRALPEGSGAVVPTSSLLPILPKARAALEGQLPGTDCGTAEPREPVVPVVPVSILSRPLSFIPSTCSVALVHNGDGREPVLIDCRPTRMTGINVFALSRDVESIGSEKSADAVTFVREVGRKGTCSLPDRWLSALFCVIWAVSIGGN